MPKHKHILDRVIKLREHFRNNKINAFLITSYDEYLNEYVDNNKSYRTFISDFTGTSGDILITESNAYLFVDGRYHSQAEYQTDLSIYTVEKVGLDEANNQVPETITNRMIKILKNISINKDIRVGFDPKQIAVRTIQYIKSQIKELEINVNLKPIDKNPLDDYLPQQITQKETEIYNIPITISGRSFTDKVSNIQQKLIAKNIDAFFVSKLDEIAYLTNLRSNQMDFNSTFKAYGLLTTEQFYLFTDENIEEIQEYFKETPHINILPIHTINQITKSFVDKRNNKVNILIDPTSTNYKMYLILKDLSKEKISIIEDTNNPIKEMKAIKNLAELAHIKECLMITDNVVTDTIQEIKKSAQKEENVSEENIKQILIKNYKKYSVNDLSFNPICSIGSNSAIVHYTDTDKNKLLKENELILIDTGGYFKGGYATDITRTFIAKGHPTSEQKRTYTIVLKASIKGLKCTIPPNTDGSFLDNIVRSEIIKSGYNYIHGTGHGIGILVHESPPSISYGESSKVILKENMLFSIEPGIYIEGWGGIRFENIVTIVKHSDPIKAESGWLETQCLTFAPVEEALIDRDLLLDEEIDFLELFSKSFKKLNNSES